MILTARDAKTAGLCVQGQKRFCEAHDIDFRKFLKDGIDTGELAHIQDVNLGRAILVAQKRGMHDGRR